MTWSAGPWADLVPFAFAAVNLVLFTAGYLTGVR
jgi:hypothetical protein